MHKHHSHKPKMKLASYCYTHLRSYFLQQSSKMACKAHMYAKRIFKMLFMPDMTKVY